MILEGLVTTLNPDESPNIAPMGPIVEPDMRRFVLRPFKTATTYRNLKRLGEGVLHVTDDVLMLARAAIGPEVEAKTRRAVAVRGHVLIASCRYYEFRVIELDDHEERTTIHAETVAEGRLRDFFGLNRAKHAVVEAAILATRTAFLPVDEIMSEFRKLEVLVRKTGGDAEREAFALLSEHVHEIARSRGLALEAPRS
jgi:uncharacterized protein